jgi:hypothetical protein
MLRISRNILNARREEIPVIPDDPVKLPDESGFFIVA